MNRLRIGTRGSPLALWQARAAAAALTRSGGPTCELVTITTTGDRLTQAVLSEVGGKSVFVKEIEEALLDETIDVAVHSAKDLPGQLPPGLSINAVLPREDPRDAIVLPMTLDSTQVSSGNGLAGVLDSSPTIGTGSVRRAAQLAALFPTAVFQPIRGNVETRLRKLDEGGFDLLVLASAGLVRLGKGSRISQRLSFDDCVPAPGQGIVAIETRTADTDTRSALAAISDGATMDAFTAERALLSALGGDCHVPIGGVTVADGDDLTLTAVVASVDGTRILREQQRGPSRDAATLGDTVAQALLNAGAAEIITAGRTGDGLERSPGS